MAEDEVEPVEQSGNEETPKFKFGLDFDLAIGVGSDTRVREVELLKSNGVSEKVYLKRPSGKPFTWYANVIAISFARIGDVRIAGAVRETFLKEGTVEIPGIVKQLTLSDANSALIEVHRRCWQNFIPKQQCKCRECGKRFVMDLDLNELDYTEQTKQLIAEIVEHGLQYLEADLDDGFEFTPYMRIGATDKKMHEEFAGNYNRFCFRAPTLGDAMKYEKYADDTVTLWRHLAYETLVSVQRVENDEVVETLPREVAIHYGMKMYNTLLSGRDLRKIREVLRETLPIIPFAYEAECPHCYEQTPVMMQPQNFFSE